MEIKKLKKILMLVIVAFGISTVSLDFVVADNSFIIVNTAISSHNTGNQTTNGTDGKDGTRGKDGEAGEDGKSTVNVSTVQNGINGNGKKFILDKNNNDSFTDTKLANNPNQQNEQSNFIPKAMEIDYATNPTKDIFVKQIINNNFNTDSFQQLFSNTFTALPYDLPLWRLLESLNRPVYLFDTTYYYPLQYSHVPRP